MNYMNQKGITRQQIIDAVNLLITATHGQARVSGWWTDLATNEDLTSGPGESPKRNVPEMLMLIVSEAAEAMEGHRKNLQDDHLPQYSALTVESADIMIRVADMAGGLNINVAEAFADKLFYNAERADHKLDNRAKDGGKKF